MARKAPEDKKLTVLQQNFVYEYMIDLNATKACLRAGYKVAESNAPKLASQLLNTPNVAKAVAKQREKKLERNLVTADYVLQKLVDICEKTEDDNPQAAIRALELLGKNLGLYKERTEISGHLEQSIEHKQKLEQDAESFTSAISRLANRGGEGTVVEFPNKRAEG